VKAFVLKRAAAHNVKTVFFERAEFYHSDKILDLSDIGKIIICGSWQASSGWFPDNISESMKKDQYNYHPALLPAHGGKAC